MVGEGGGTFQISCNATVLCYVTWASSQDALGCGDVAVVLTSWVEHDFSLSFHPMGLCIPFSCPRGGGGSKALELFLPRKAWTHSCAHGNLPLLGSTKKPVLQLVGCAKP